MNPSSYCRLLLLLLLAFPTTVTGEKSDVEQPVRYEKPSLSRSVSESCGPVVSGYTINSSSHNGNAGSEPGDNTNPEKFTLTGKITDPEGSPLSGATIWISELQTGTATNQTGYFELPDLIQGEWTVVVRYIGYQTVEKPIPWPEEAGKLFHITLQKEIIRTDELLVIGNLFERITRYQPTQSYSASDVQQRNTSSIGTMLDGEPGVSMRSMGNATARPVIRGMDGERIQVLQNGMKMGDFSSTGHDHAVILDPATIDRVDIIRGPASLIYGSSAMGGIINIHSGDIPSGWSTGTSGYIGAEGQSGMASLSGVSRVTYGTDNKAFTLRSSLRNTGNMRTPAGEIPGTEMHSTHVGAGGAWRYNTGYSGGSIQYSDKKYGIPENPFEVDEEVQLAMQRLAVQGISHLHLDHPFWEAAETRLVYNYYTHKEIAYEYVDGVLDNEDLELNINHHFIQTDVLLQHGKKGTLDNGTLGFTFEWRNVLVGGEEVLTPDARGWTLAGFLIEEIRLPRNWSLQSGIRVEWNQINPMVNAAFPEVKNIRSQGVWAGSVGASGPLSENLETGIQLSRAHRTPSLEELFADAIHFAAGAYETGNPALKSEIGYGLDLFMDYRTCDWQFHLALFAYHITNYITLRPTGNTEPDRGYPILKYYSSDAQFLGGEVTVKRKLNDWLELSLGSDYILGSELQNKSHEPLPFMPPLRIFAGTTLETGRWSYNLRVRHVFAQNRTAEAEDKTDGYTLTEVSVGAKLGSNNIHHIHLCAENLFHVTWRDHLSRIERRDIPMIGRNIRLSYRYIF